MTGHGGRGATGALQRADGQPTGAGAIHSTFSPVAVKNTPSCLLPVKSCPVMRDEEQFRGGLLSVGARRCWIPRFPTNRPRLARQANQRRIAAPLVHSLAHPWLQGFCPLSSSSKNLVSLLGRLAAGAMPACHPILPSLPTLPTTFSIHPVAHFPLRDPHQTNPPPWMTTQARCFTHSCPIAMGPARRRPWRVSHFP